MMRIHQYSMLCASIISQEAALEAIQRGQPDTTEMRDQYRLRRNFIVNALQQHGAQMSSAARLVLRIPVHQSTGLSSKEFALRLLKEEKVACVPGQRLWSERRGIRPLLLCHSPGSNSDRG